MVSVMSDIGSGRELAKGIEGRSSLTCFLLTWPACPSGMVAEPCLGIIDERCRKWEEKGSS